MHGNAQNRGRIRDMGELKMKHTIKFSDTSDLYDYLAENFPNLKFDSKYSQSETLRRFTCDGISLITYFNQYLVIYL